MFAIIYGATINAIATDAYWYTCCVSNSDSAQRGFARKIPFYGMVNKPWLGSEQN